jgi:hypothetical protein
MRTSNKSSNKQERECKRASEEVSMKQRGGARKRDHSCTLGQSLSAQNEQADSGGEPAQVEAVSHSDPSEASSSSMAESESTRVSVSDAESPVSSAEAKSNWKSSAPEVLATESYEINRRRVRAADVEEAERCDEDEGRRMPAPRVASEERQGSGRASGKATLVAGEEAGFEAGWPWRLYGPNEAEEARRVREARAVEDEADEEAGSEVAT